MKFLLKLFPPNNKYISDIGRLLASGQYEVSAEYIHKADQKALARTFDYHIVKSEKIVDSHMQHRYKMFNDLYETVFKKKSKYFDQKLYDVCMENADKEDKPLNFYVDKLKGYFE